jgi:NTE family protein
MSLNTILSAGSDEHARSALVLMGGGARTAYQAGVLKAVGSLLGLQPSTPGASAFAFNLLVGTSAGALNAAFLASRASQGLMAFEALADFWHALRSQQVYQLDAPWWLRTNKLLAASALFKGARQRNALLNSMPLVDTLHHAIGLPQIEQALQSGALDGLAVTASSYSSGAHWTFCQVSEGLAVKPWHRTGRHAQMGPITIDHLVASAAIPFLFPATPLWVQTTHSTGHREFFGDGSMRQVSPLSPAIHLGATKIMVIGVGQPQRAALGAKVSANNQSSPQASEPSLGAIAGHAMASVFHDTLQADVEQVQRVSDTIRQLPAAVASVLPYRPVQVLALQPSRGLDEIAAQHARYLPRSVRTALASLGARNNGGASLASYLLFEPSFVQALMQLGEQDAYARKAEVLAFFAPQADAVF